MAEVNETNIRQLQDTLLSWYKKNRREFPWRKNGLSNYQLIIAEVLLQRTKAETVSTFFDSFVVKFPNWHSLSIAETSEIENQIKAIGLQAQRAKRLKSLAIEMVERNEVLPEDRVELETLPFLGQYIANSIELLIFKRNKPLLDVNMARLLERYFKPRIKVDIRYDPLLLDLSHKLVNHPTAKLVNWAVLDFAALVCKAGKPLCNECILKLNCTYFKSQYNS